MSIFQTNTAPIFSRLLLYFLGSSLAAQTLPDDPDFLQQTTLERAGFPTAWTQTTGGITYDGRPIVIAILDAGFDTEHPDLRDNLWRNAAEIPGNGIDDDDNGYVDDVHGWSFRTQGAEFPADIHGTQVAGMIGARGNNGIGIAGTNWNTQLMLLAVSSSGEVVRAYEYIAEQRERYNQSGGAEGAFVVVTNASLGVEGARCDRFPEWRDIYPRLGRAGVLSVASAANRSWDIDTNGDMPASCPSDYVIGVTNVDAGDFLYRSSAFGREHVDLAAPGEGSLTTRPRGSYGTFGSTSAAAPLVTGAIALLYAGNCETLIGEALDDPARAALRVRRAVLESVSSRPNLIAGTATGGVLDVAEAQIVLDRNCSVLDPEIFAIQSVTPNPVTTTARVQTSAGVLTSDLAVTLTGTAGRQAPLPRPRPNANGSFTLDFTGLSPGWYLLTVTDRERTAVTKIIIR